MANLDNPLGWGGQGVWVGLGGSPTHPVGWGGRPDPFG